MKAWIRASAVESESDSRSQEMFLRRWSTDLVMDLMCDWNERVEYRIILWLQTSKEGDIEQLKKAG